MSVKVLDNTLGDIIKTAFVTMVDIFLYSGFVYFIWNWIMPKLGIVVLANYWQAVALFMLSRFLLNDHILTSDPIVVHCDCEGEIETPMVVEDKK